MKRKKRMLKKESIRWSLEVTVLSFVLSILLTLIATKALDGAGLFMALLLLVAIILLGIAFDMFGIATTTASEKPFHSMATRRVNGAPEALHFIKHADRVSSICNDVVGDICGIISGTSSTLIVALLISEFTVDGGFTNLLVSGLLAGLTVGGKALGKPIAMKHNTQIVLFVGRIMYTYKSVRKKLRRKLKIKKR